MQTRTYFIIPVAALLGFAIWYQDFDRRYAGRQQAAATVAAEEKVRLAQIAELDRVKKIKAMQAQLEERRLRKVDLAAQEAAAQARRNADRDALAIARDEIAALRVQRQRLTHEITGEDVRIRNREAEHAALMAERGFLQEYNSRAHASVARVEAAVAEVERIRVAAAVENAVATPAPAQRTR